MNNNNIVYKNFSKISNNIVIIQDNIILNDLSKYINVDIDKLIDILSKFGFIYNKNSFVNINLAKFLINQLCLIKNYEFRLDTKYFLQNNNINFIKYPVISIIGHVDQGKTSLVDNICNTNFINNEIGYITQKINCNFVSVNNVDNIVFLDTPGHEIFSSTRIISLLSSDIILLIISINDINNKLNIELFNTLLMFNLPIILAINKIDMFENSSILVEKFLIKHNLSTIFCTEKNNLVLISVKQSKGLKLLKDNIIKVFNDNYCLNDNNYSYGTIIDSYLDKNGSYVVLALLKNGIIKFGDIIICGYEYCKIKFIIDQNNIRYNYYEKSLPIKIGFFSGVVEPGLDFYVCNSEKNVKEIIKTRNDYKRLVSLDVNINRSKKEFINFIIKTDSKNMYDILYKLVNEMLKNDFVLIKIIDSKIGEFNTSELNLFSDTKINILCFNIQIKKSICIKLDKRGIKYFFFENIYNFTFFLQEFYIKIKKKYLNEITGIAQVKNIFKIKNSCIAGCILQTGIILINNKVQIYRDQKLIFEGYISSLKKIKKSVDIINLNEEFGIVIKGFDKFLKNDILKFFSR